MLCTHFVYRAFLFVDKVCISLVILCKRGKEIDILPSIAK